MDCAEVREKVYKFPKSQDFNFQCIVARKNLESFRKKFDLKEAKKGAVSKVMSATLNDRNANLLDRFLSERMA